MGESFSFFIELIGQSLLFVPVAALAAWALLRAYRRPEGVFHTSGKVVVYGIAIAAAPLFVVALLDPASNPIGLGLLFFAVSNLVLLWAGLSCLGATARHIVDGLRP